MSFSPFLAVQQDCGRVLQWTIEQLTQAGLHTVQTFDLNTARTGAGDCPCHAHGTLDCDCQMVILFVYEPHGDPVALILHGNQGQTWLSFAETPASGGNAKLAKSIQGQLEAGAEDFRDLL